MKPRIFFHPHCHCTCPRCSLNQPWVLDIAQARSQAMFLTPYHLAGKRTFARYLLHRVPSPARSWLCVSPPCNCVSPQSLTTELSNFSTLEPTSATHVNFSGPKMCERFSLDSRTKICDKYTEWLPSDAQLTVQSSPTNLLEQSSLVPSTVSGVSHTHVHRGLAPRRREYCLKSPWLHTVLFRVIKRLQGFEEMGMIWVFSN